MPILTRWKTTAPHDARHGFTIVELLVVIAIIGLLIGIIMPALGGARRRSLKGSELSSLRQIGIAWNLYAQSNREAAIPGVLPLDVQLDWNVTYTYPNKTSISPVNASPWTARLFSYLNTTLTGFLGYRNLEELTAISLGNVDPIIDPAYGDTFEPLYNVPTPRDTTFSFQPAFAYNAYYVGGWYQYQNDGNHRPRYIDQARVVRSISHIQNSTKITLFASATGIPVGGDYRLLASSDRPGSHFITPGWLGQQRIWSQASYTSAPDYIEIVGTGPDTPYAGVPLGRYTGQVALVHGDMHVEATAPGNLDDQRVWVNGATVANDPTHD